MKCPRCKSRPKQEHRNAKWCKPCSDALKRSPVGKLTAEQERKVRRLAKTMFIKELAREVGTSDSNLDRWARQNGVNINALKYPKELVDEVCEFYATHGKRKTRERFPNVRVRSIVERYQHESRQIRWTADQLIKLAQMGGLVSPACQATFFNRPRANAGSIKSVWMKRFGHGAANINGLPRRIARHFVKASCPYYETGFWEARGRTKQRRSMALWMDVALHMRDDVPDHLAHAIVAVARFQLWLHGEKPRAKIEAILREEL